MPFTKLNGQGHTQLGPNYRGVDYVSELDNKPNDVGGLNPTQLKAISTGMMMLLADTASAPTHCARITASNVLAVWIAADVRTNART